MDKKEVMLLVGLAFGLAAGFVLGWLWGDRPNSLSDVRALDVLIAIGTIGAALAAAYNGRVALNIEKANEANQKKLVVKRAKEYFASLHEDFEEWIGLLGQAEGGIYREGIKRADPVIIKDIYMRIKSLDLFLLSELDPSIRDMLTQTRNELYYISTEFVDRDARKVLHELGRGVKVRNLLKKLKDASSEHL